MAFQDAHLVTRFTRYFVQVKCRFLDRNRVSGKLRKDERTRGKRLSFLQWPDLDSSYPLPPSISCAPYKQTQCSVGYCYTLVLAKVRYLYISNRGWHSQEKQHPVCRRKVSLKGAKQINLRLNYEYFQKAYGLTFAPERKRMTE